MKKLIYLFALLINYNIYSVQLDVEHDTDLIIDLENPDSMSKMRDAIKKIDAELGQLNDEEIKVLTELNSLTDLNKTIKNNENKIKDLNNIEQKTNFEYDLIKVLQKNNRDIKDKYPDIEKKISNLTSDSNDIKISKNKLLDLYNKISTRLGEFTADKWNDYKYKKIISIVFAGLIFAVIVGFFVIAYHDENVRKNVFSGNAGIQLLTIFSLIISIILFGILEILDGKELSALLGGLSGFILGKYGEKIIGEK